MMRILFLADLHLDNHKPFSRIRDDGRNSRLVEIEKAVDAVFAKIENYTNTTILLGDLFHSLTAHMEKDVLKTAIEIVEAISCKSGNMYIIVGNHDIYKDSHTLHAVKHIPGVTVVDQTGVVTLSQDFRGAKMALVPWGGFIPAENADFLAGHLQIAGAEVGSGFSIGVGVKARQLSRFPHVILGHYHKRQQIGPNIHYIGSIIPHSFSDINSPAGGYLLEGEDGEISGKYIDIEAPKFRTVHISTLDELKFFHKNVRNSTDYFRILVHSDDVTVTDIGHNIQVQYVYEVESLKKILPETWDIVKIAKDFIAASNTTLDKDKIFKELDVLIAAKDLENLYRDTHTES